MNSPDIILFCAFRYAIGRSTYVVDVVVDEILKRWENLSQSDKELYAHELLEHIRKFGRIGMECDAKSWKKILDRAVHDDIIKSHPL